MTSLLLTLAVALVSAPGAQADPGRQEHPPSWGLDRIDQRDPTLDGVYGYDSTADTVTAYVIDTGVDAKQPDFEGRVEPGKNFVEGTDDASDGNGEGTRLASILGGKDFGVAKKVRLVPVRVLDNTGNGRLTNILAGIDWVAKNAKQPAVAVLGIGGPVNDSLDNAVRILAAVMPVAVPAGWSGSDTSQSSPGRVAEALTVGASDVHDTVSPKSGTGAGIDVFAPGVDIPSATVGGAPTASGTSMAAAFVAGAAALYRAAHPQASPAEVSQAIVDHATPGVLTGVPQGTPDRLLCTVEGD